MNTTTTKTKPPLMIAAQCERIANDLQNRLPEIQPVKPALSASKEYQGIDGARDKFNDCTEAANQAAKNERLAVAQRDEIKAALVQASEQLRYAEESYSALCGRATETDNSLISEIRANVAQIQNDLKAANRAVDGASSKLSLAYLNLNNARRDLVKLQAVLIMREGLINAGLFDALKHTIILARAENPQMSSYDVKESIIGTIFNALFDDGKIPPFEQSRDFFNNFQAE